ncbi:complement component C8 alpha chain isoform X3 [Opisthocomus hoazin]|uniref:complement component C8 alpha chain isoform X3 n=1 Tax=Opisthocomus hoazin TaxID=30419 RepID=UPI003F52CA1C
MRWSLCPLSPLILSVCWLALTARQATATARRELEALPSQRRSSRDVNSPAPIDCQLSQWSGWTDCFPCQEKKVVVLNGILCATESETAEMGLMRKTVRTKILKALVNICSQSQGLKKQPKGHCEYVYNGEWRELKYDAACEHLYYGDDEKYFRKPYNFHIYQFLAYADSGFTFEFYDDSKDLLDALKSDKFKTKGFTIGIGPGESAFQLDLGFTLSGGKGSLKNFTQYTAKEVGFIRGTTKVQTAHFKMRRDNIVLDEDVLLSLWELPDTYNYGMYAKFINDYGTHFMTSGTMGGVFEYILVINKEEMRRKDISAEEISACIGWSLGLTVRETEVQLEASVSSSDCAKKGFLKTDAETHSAVVEDIIPRIRGGDTSYSGGLLNSWDGNMYRHWGRSLKYNPAVIDFELQPIHEILRRSNLGNMETKRQNLKRALDDYLLEFNACRCGPCQNNGEPILVGDTCFCQCRPGDGGPACEQTRRQGGETDGRWNCWSPWGPCQSGTARRSRQCNNPAPQRGGQPCAGRDLQSRAC